VLALIEDVALITPLYGLFRAFQHRRLQSGFPYVKGVCIHNSAKHCLLGYMTVCFFLNYWQKYYKIV